MIYISKKILPFLCICLTLNSSAQKNSSPAPTIQAGRDKDFKIIDDYAKKIGRLDSMTMGSISNLLTKRYTDKTDKVRAIYTWIATNISYDLKAGKNNDNDKNSSTQVLLYRKGTAAGYANLFQDMCSSAGVRCLTINGFVKNTAEQIKDTKTEINHTWAIVQLGESPEAWYFVDPCWGSGYTDADYKIFTPSFNPSYFFADLTIFNWQHFPDNLSWRIGPGTKSKKDFFELPIIKSAAYEFGLKKFAPYAGSVKVRTTSFLPFNFQLSSDALINKVAIVITDGKKKLIKDVPFTFNNGALSFNYKFKEEDSFPVTVLINGKEFADYFVEVVER
jgi:transglutaminase/protease-like cytokinesis protein 3